MPRAWTKKDERQFDHVKESELDRGRSETKAAEIAGRTVNKTRREQGRTPNKRTQGTGNPNLPLAERTRDELYNLAKELNVSGRSKMTKGDLVATLKR
jgi:hypothetical protein